MGMWINIWVYHVTLFIMLVYGLAELSWVYLGLVDMLAAIPTNTQAWKTTFQPQRQGYSRGTAPHLATPSLRFVEIVTGGHGKLWVTAKEDAQIFSAFEAGGFWPMRWELWYR